MGATYTRQSTYADGDTITAAHTNDEFDQLLAAFAASTGHTHDGTTGEGGPISTMAGHALTFGAGTSGTDIVLTFDGESNDGVLKWMEDEDYFEFSDDILIATTEKIQFRDTGLYINSSADGQLDIVADTEIQIAATTVDINGLVDISGNLSVGGNLDVTGTFDLSDANFTNAGDIQLDSISGDADTNTSITFSGSDVITVATGGSTAFTVNADQSVTFAGNVIIGSANIAEAELEILDGASVTTAELNLIDGDTARGTTAVASGDGILINDAGTMRMTNVDTVSTYFAGHSVGGSSIVTTGALNSGSITSGFGTIDTGSSTITTTGLISGGSLDIDSVLINGTTIGHTDDTDLITLANGVVTVAGEISVTTLDIGGTNVTSTAAELNILDGKAFLDEDDLSSDSATGIPSQQSVKAYVDNNASAITASSTTTFTNKTLTAAKIVDGGFLADANGNELVVFQTTSSAVNQLEITNNASGSDPILAATGGDTNIGITLTPKGTGVITIAAGNLDYGGTAVTSTGAELNALDGITAVVGELNALDLGSTAVGTAIASKAVVLDSSKDYTGIRNLTISGEIDAATGDFSGVVDVAGALTTAEITASGIIKTDNSTAATSTTDGSLQTDGGLSVVLDAVIGDDLLMLSDASVIHFGADSDVTLTHVADVGLALKHTATADDKPIVLTLQTGETDMAANDVIGKLAFQAPDEGTGTDAILVAAAVQAVAEGDFSSSNNATRLEFHTGASELAAVKMTLNSTGAVKPVTYQETYVSLSPAATVNCPLLTANHFAVTLDQNTTFTFGDPPASGTSFAFTLIVTQHSTAVTLTWPGTVDWAGGSAPDAAGNNEVQAYGFITRDGGTTYYGFLGGTAIG